MNRLVQHALSLVLPQFELSPKFSPHGIAHWARVWRNARELCEAEGLDATVPCLFSFLHDSRRLDDGRDEDHGPRAVQFIETLYLQRRLPAGMSDFHLLCLAVEGHSFGETRAHPIVQVCWDADRLDLGRVGMIPNPLYLCTEHARKPETIRLALNRSLGLPRTNTQPPDWMR